MKTDEIILQDEGKLQEILVAIENARTLAQIMSLAFRLACLLTVGVVETILAERANRTCRWPGCPQCGARVGNKDRAERSIRTLVGTVTWKRKIGRCPNGCEIGQVVPLDEELGLEPNQRVCADVKRMGCLLAVFVPYGIASVLLALIAKLTVSPMTIWNWAQEAGARSMKSLEAELDALRRGGNVDQEAMEEILAQLPLIIGGDGVHVPFRPNEGSPEGKTEWKEVKVGILARLKRYVNRKGRSVTRLLRRRLVAVLGDVDEFIPRMELEARKQGVRNARSAVWISDGGRGFWRVFDTLFSHCAVPILDFYHAAQNLWKASAAWLDGRTRRSRQWFDQARHWLRHGRETSPLRKLDHVVRTDDEMDDESWGVVNACYEYLDAHRQHMRYSHFKDELGLPIGSGMVESACKWLIQQRFKCVGMRWSRRGFNHLLHLRLAWVNGRFDELFGVG